MAYSVDVNGNITTDDVEEALALQRKILARRQAVEAKTQGAPARAKGRRMVVPNGLTEDAKRVLAIIAEAGTNGLSTEQLAAQAGFKEKRAISAPIQAIRRRIGDLLTGQPVEHFIWKETSPDRMSSMWFANAEALAEIGLLRGGK